MAEEQPLQKQSVKNRLKDAWTYISPKLTSSAHHKGYWIQVAILIAVSIWLSHWLAKQDIWPEFRYKIYQTLTTLTWRKAIPLNTYILLIEDEEYWKGELARRVPIKRNYLAKLIRALHRAEPAIIALDFDFASPMPDGSLVEHPDYETETRELLEAIKDVGKGHKIVLPQAIAFDQTKEKYILQSNIYDKFDFGPAESNIYKGYIALTYDIRRVPLQLELATGGYVDSFALAIVKAHNPDVLQRLPKNTSPFPFGGFLEPDQFHRVGASKVLNGDESVMRALSHKIVVIGAAWHRKAYGDGSVVDLHFSPVGSIGGAVLHANFVESILDGRLFSKTGEVSLTILEIVLVFGGAMLFALKLHPGWKWGLIAIASLLLLLLSYVLIQNLGIFFEFLLPAVFVGIHALTHQILEWRACAKLNES